jgi:hypothetical protein
MAKCGSSRSNRQSRTFAPTRNGATIVSIAIGCFSPLTLDVPCGIFPPDAGLIVADAFGASIACEAPEHRLHAGTRKRIMLAFARAAALRLAALADPEGRMDGLS